MNHKLASGISVEIRDVYVKDAEAVISCMTTVIKETKNLAREPEEWMMTIKQEETFLQQLVDSPHQYMAIALDGNQVIATAGFHANPLQRLRHRASLGISIRQKYHNLGLGTLLMNHLIVQAKHMGKRILELEVRKDNYAAIKLYEKVGFLQEGIKKQAFYVDGKYIDMIMMAIYL